MMIDDRSQNAHQTAHSGPWRAFSRPVDGLLDGAAAPGKQGPTTAGCPTYCGVMVQLPGLFRPDVSTSINTAPRGKTTDV